MNKDLDIYIDSIISLTKEENIHKEFLKELKNIKFYFDRNPRIYNFVKSLSIDLSEKISFFEKCISSKNVKLKKYFMSYIEILLKDNKGLDFAFFLNSLVLKYLKTEGTKIGIVWSREVIDERDLLKIKETLMKKQKEKFFLLNKIDKEILGGIKLDVNGKVYDYSINVQLNNLVKSIMKEVKNSL